MKVEYLLNNIYLTREQKKNIVEKLEKLEKFSDEIKVAKIDLSFRPSRSKEEAVRLEVNLTLPHKLLRAVVKSSNSKDAVDQVDRILKRQIRKYKTYGEAKKRMTQKEVRKLKRR